MVFPIEVNGKQIQAKTGETILTALQRHGIEVPTLCHMESLNATGACRICVVEVEGKNNLVTSCSQLVEPEMKIKTHSPRVIESRKTLVELLLANHPDDCLFCPGNGKCELQQLAVALNVRERRYPGSRTHLKLDQSSNALVREPDKCILCGRCVRTCEEIVGISTLDFMKRGEQVNISTTFGKPLNQSNCITCGQCILACPTAALREKDHFIKVQEVLHDPRYMPVIQVSPAVSVSIAEMFGLKPGKDHQGILYSLLRRLGFKWVYDSTFAVDLMILELTDNLLAKRKTKEPFPLFSSCCPAWVKHAEQSLPELLPHLFPYKSPHLIMGSLIKDHLSKTCGIPPEQIHLTTIGPCTAQKFEIQREDTNALPYPYVDVVLTTRELEKLSRMNGINAHQLAEGKADLPFMTRSSAGKLSANSGGVTEALIRTLYHRLTGTDIEGIKLSKLRNAKERKELVLNIKEEEYRFAVVSSIRSLQTLLQEIRSGKKTFDFVEVMACPGGCLFGGGQPWTNNSEVLAMRIKTLYEIDDRDSIRFCHKNPNLIELYNNNPDVAGKDSFQSFFETSFSIRKVLR